ncbi:MAG TPA: penicillin-binding protein 2 [candidate division Zixibacteria bacterium]|nr:penicillin-binding protein 2 [candidate division Zixibacteria bacterium]
MEFDATEKIFAQNRQRVFMAVFLVFMLAIVARLFYLQILNYDYYYNLSENNRIRVLPVPAARGKILDRNGRVLVDNKPTYTVSIMPYEFPGDTASVEKLAELLDLDPEYIWQKYQKTREIKYLPIRIKSRVDERVVSYLAEHSGEYPGVVYQVVPTRRYPYGKVAPHILGYVGEVSAAELRQRYKEGIKAGDMVGKQGVERYFDNLLRGRDGAKFLEVRANGEVVGPVRDRKDIPPENGADLTLTIDLDIQRYLEYLAGFFDRGAIVVMNPNNGEILGAVSTPDFDNTVFAEPITDSLWRALNDPKTHPMLCRWYQGTYPPASPLKLMAAAAAVDENIANGYTKMEYPCTGAMPFGDRYFFCWLRSGHGYLNMFEAIAQSCDIYFYQVGAKLGLDKWSEYARECFFGKPTGIELPHEAAGLVPDRDYYNRRYGRRGWGAGVVLNLVIGQGEVLVTPLQMAQFVAAIANGGTVWKPTVVLSAKPPHRHELKFLPQKRGELPFSPEAIKTVIEGMVRTCNEEWATGYGAHMDDITVAGKTGTAQNPHGPDHAWFVSFAPAEKPEVVMVILVEAGGSGGSWAWLARAFYDYYFHYWKFEHRRT